MRGPHAARVQSYARQCGCLPGLLHHVSVTVVAELLTMKLQPICDLIDLLAIRMQSDANELKSLGRNCLYRSPVVSIVVSDKQTAGVDGWGQPALICATQSSCKLMARRRIDQDRLPNERAVSPAGCIDIGLTGEPWASSNLPGMSSRPMRSAGKQSKVTDYSLGPSHWTVMRHRTAPCAR